MDGASDMWPMETGFHFRYFARRVFGYRMSRGLRLELRKINFAPSRAILAKSGRYYGLKSGPECVLVPSLPTSTCRRAFNQSPVNDEAIDDSNYTEEIRCRLCVDRKPADFHTPYGQKKSFSAARLQPPTQHSDLGRRLRAHACAVSFSMGVKRLQQHLLCCTPVRRIAAPCGYNFPAIASSWQLWLTR